MARKRGNPNWGKPAPYVVRSASPTEFDKQVRRLRLTEQNLANSDRLRMWCKENKNRFYIPEKLLMEWKISVDASVGD